jgi:hypothetical protein
MAERIFRGRTMDCSTRKREKVERVSINIRE